MTPQEFFDLVAPAAKQSAAVTKVPASFVIAEGALESAWGESLLFKNALNMFGVKADLSWTGDVYSLQTREFSKGTWIKVPARWRKYSDLKSCIDDHAKFLLTNKRYRGCFAARNSEEFASAVAKAGYATDPDYAAKIIAIIRKYNLSTYDEVA